MCEMLEIHGLHVSFLQGYSHLRRVPETRVILVTLLYLLNPNPKSLASASPKRPTGRAPLGWLHSHRCWLPSVQLSSTSCHLFHLPKPFQIQIQNPNPATPVQSLLVFSWSEQRLSFPSRFSALSNLIQTQKPAAYVKVSSVSCSPKKVSSFGNWILLDVSESTTTPRL